MGGTVLVGATVPARDFGAAKREVPLAVEDYLASIFAEQPDSDAASAARYAVIAMVDDMRQALDGAASEEERLLRRCRLKSKALYGTVIVGS